LMIGRNPSIAMRIAMIVAVVERRAGELRLKSGSG